MVERLQMQTLVASIADECQTPFMPQFWREIVVRRLSQHSDADFVIGVSRRLRYLNEQLHSLNSTDWSTTTKANQRFEFVAEFIRANSLPAVDQFSPRSWFIWAIAATEANHTGLAIYCLTNHWLLPAYSEQDYVSQIDEIAFRMLRCSFARARGIDLAVNFTFHSEDFRDVAPSFAVRKDVEDLLNVQTGLKCLGVSTKKYLEAATRLNSETWQSEYLSKNLRYVKQHIDAFCNDPHSDGERAFSELARSLRKPANWDDFFATFNSDLADIYDYLRAANRLISQGNYVNALYVLARLYTLPEIAAEDRSEFAMARILVSRCIRLVRHEPLLEVGYQEALVQMAGLSWQDNDRVSHEAVCPLCSQGNRFGSGNYSVELRAYFSGSPAKASFKNKLPDSRFRLWHDFVVPITMKVAAF